jgi:hypothetical protein
VEADQEVEEVMAFPVPILSMMTLVSAMRTDYLWLQQTLLCETLADVTRMLILPTQMMVHRWKWASEAVAKVSDREAQVLVLELVLADPVQLSW